jgi:FAD dependent oxidoreductase
MGRPVDRRQQGIFAVLGPAAGLLLTGLALGSVAQTQAAGVDSLPEAAPAAFDLVAYDSTPAGLSAAIAARRAGLTALVLSPYEHLGGLTTSGLGATDVGHPAAIGGLAREFYLRLAAHYAGGETAWDAPVLAPVFRFEPSVAEAILEAWLQAEGVEVWRGIEVVALRQEAVPGNAGTDSEATGLELEPAVGTGDRATPSVLTQGERRIAELVLADGRRVLPRVIIDASYEGDLLPLAGVPFRIGREANHEHGETLNGVQFARAVYHQFGAPIDAYVQPGVPASGLLPEVDGSEVLPDGSADERLQAYCFRLCLTRAENNRIPFAEPPGYDPARYELLLRWFDSGADWLPLHPVEVPNQKTDTNNNGPVSSDWIGGNRQWLTASQAQRQSIADEHQRWQTGLLWTLASHPRVPEPVRREAAAWGFAADEFVDNNHWPYRLYVREGRRLVGDLVMTEQHCRGLATAEEPIGMAAYTMDSHHVRRQVQDGQVWNEGDVQVGGFAPFPVGYRALLPPRGSVVNLGVPVCLSASHIAYGSIRMEPVFFVLGQALGQAAALAKDGNLLALDYEQLRADLLSAGQVLELPVAAMAARANQQNPPVRDPGELAVPTGYTLAALLDDGEARFVGPWAESKAASQFLGPGYRHDAGSAGGRRAEWRLALPPGRYLVELGYPSASNRASNTTVRLKAPLVHQSLELDQRLPGAPRSSYRWALVGALELGEPSELVIEVENRSADGVVVIDALRALRVSTTPP